MKDPSAREGCREYGNTDEERNEIVVTDIAQCLWMNQEGQDLTEYALILAFVVLAAAGIFLVGGSSIVTIWSVSNTIVTNGAAVAHTGVS